MKKTIVFLCIVLLVCFQSNAQMTLAHSFTQNSFTESSIVNLSISGKKIMTFTDTKNCATTGDTINFYNLDFSLWKSIVCPFIPGYRGYFNILHDEGQGIGIFYPSETLFNTDSFLEVAVYYFHPGDGLGKILIINENGAIVDSILNVVIFDQSPSFKVFEVDTLGTGFQAVVATNTGTQVYNLPGTLPCAQCIDRSGYYSYLKPQNNINTEFSPNPSSDKVKITFTLPKDINRGEIQLFNSFGTMIKSYQVDDHFGYILLDNTQLKAGIYYYNVIANGSVSATQKMVVIK